MLILGTVVVAIMEESIIAVTCATWQFHICVSMKKSWKHDAHRSLLMLMLVFFPDSQVLKAIQMCINRSMGKGKDVYAYYEVL